MYQRDFVREVPAMSAGIGAGGASKNQIFHIDWILLLLLLVLIAFGLTILYSASEASYAYMKRQLFHIVAGFILMIILAQFDPRFYMRISPFLYILGLIALVCVLFWGVGAKGAQRWLQIGNFPRFQPSELMKLVLPIVVARILSRQHLPPRFGGVMLSLIVIMVPTVLVVRQPDLGTSLLVASSGIFVILFAGLSWWYVFSGVALMGAMVPVMWFLVMLPYQKQRVMTFLNPEADALGSGWNITQSKIAIGSGGINGKGWQEGTQSQLDFLPESHTDFIIAVLAEEFGLMGVLTLLTLYFCILLRGFYIVFKARDSFSALVAGGGLMTFFVYIFVNMGMVSGILPVVGVPLPLISYGGTSVVALFAGMGIIMSVSSHRSYR